MMNGQHQLWMEIDREALLDNCQRLTAMGKEGGSCEILAVVKADAYGHGISVVNVMDDWGIRFFGVASVQEAEVLRNNGVRGEILLLGGFFPEDLKVISRYGLTPVISTQDDLDLLSRHSVQTGQPIHYHLKIDTGMGRMGLLYTDFDEHWLVRLKEHSSLRLRGIMTHFSCAECDPAYTHEQYTRFLQITNRAGFDCVHGEPFFRHCSNSAGFLLFPDKRLDLARIGIALYGVSPTGDPELVRKAGLKPVMSLKARVKHVKGLPAEFCVGYGNTYTTTGPARVAVLPVGYSQGLLRSLSNRMDVLIRGKRARSIGVLSMDQMMVDVSEIPDVSQGDIAVLIGQDSTGDQIRVEELAMRSGTIPHEILCSLIRIKNRITR